LGGSLPVIVTGDAKLLAIATPVGDPFAPFVVGEERGDDKDEDEYAEEDSHKG
jgi:hypothetical protein